MCATTLAAMPAASGCCCGALWLWGSGRVDGSLQAAGSAGLHSSGPHVSCCVVPLLLLPGPLLELMFALEEVPPGPNPK